MVQVIALAERGTLYDPGPCMYMEKLAVGPKVDPATVSLDKSVAENLQAVSDALDKPVSCVPRQQPLHGTPISLPSSRVVQLSCFLEGPLHNHCPACTPCRYTLTHGGTARTMVPTHFMKRWVNVAVYGSRCHYVRIVSPGRTSLAGSICWQVMPQVRRQFLAK